jgi:hypothetical protein
MKLYNQPSERVIKTVKQCVQEGLQKIEQINREYGEKHTENNENENKNKKTVTFKEPLDNSKNDYCYENQVYSLKSFDSSVYYVGSQSGVLHMDLTCSKLVDLNRIVSIPNKICGRLSDLVCKDCYEEITVDENYGYIIKEDNYVHVSRFCPKLSDVKMEKIKLSDSMITFLNDINKICPKCDMEKMMSKTVVY